MNLYKGWEIAKLISEGKLEDGTRIQKVVDCFGEDMSYEDIFYEIDNGCMYYENEEVYNSFLTCPNSRYSIVE